ncbi:hypothetical protein [Streptomyces sp. L2]|uniref:hypothetical protein n=1 Tax=Streptomyces sp. L2 TaxID=2162665 RepID=UPI001010640D|nr:hypothetical protein [Streptomyces sp. L2]
MRTPPGPLPRRTTRTDPAPARTALHARARNGARNGTRTGARTGARTAPGRAPVSYDGERALTDAPFALPPVPVPLSAAPATPDGVPGPPITAPATAPVRRMPDYAGGVGHRSTPPVHPSGAARPARVGRLRRTCDVSDLRAAPRTGGDQPGPRLVSHRDAAWAGALFAAVDAR